MAAADFAPWRVRPHIDPTSDQVLKIYLSLTEEKRQYCAHDETKPQHVSFSFFKGAVSWLSSLKNLAQMFQFCCW